MKGKRNETNKARTYWLCMPVFVRVCVYVFDVWTSIAIRSIEQKRCMCWAEVQIFRIVSLALLGEMRSKTLRQLASAIFQNSLKILVALFLREKIEILNKSLALDEKIKNDEKHLKFSYFQMHLQSRRIGIGIKRRPQRIDWKVLQWLRNHMCEHWNDGRSPYWKFQCVNVASNTLACVIERFSLFTLKVVPITWHRLWVSRKKSEFLRFLCIFSQKFSFNWILSIALHLDLLDFGDFLGRWFE